MRFVPDDSELPSHHGDAAAGAHTPSPRAEIQLVLTRAGRLAAANDAACFALGYAREALLERSIADLGLCASAADRALRVDDLQRLGSLSFAASMCTAAAEPSAWTTGTLRVLLAEDNAVNRRFGVILLTRLGHAVTAVEHGEAALAALAGGAFDVVLMDIQMPVMDGKTALTRIRDRERGRAARTPVIALTANAFDEDRQRSLDAGMDGHLTKPVRMDDLRHALVASTAPPGDAASAPPS